MKFFGILALSSVLALAAAAPQDTVEDSAEVKCVKACMFLIVSYAPFSWVEDATKQCNA